MRKVLIEGDILVLDGKEFSYTDLTRFLTERVIYKKQLDHVKELATGGVSNE